MLGFESPTATHHSTIPSFHYSSIPLFQHSMLRRPRIGPTCPPEHRSGGCQGGPGRRRETTWRRVDRPVVACGETPQPSRIRGIVAEVMRRSAHNVAEPSRLWPRASWIGPVEIGAFIAPRRMLLLSVILPHILQMRIHLRPMPGSFSCLYRGLPRWAPEQPSPAEHGPMPIGSTRFATKFATRGCGRVWAGGGGAVFRRCRYAQPPAATPPAWAVAGEPALGVVCAARGGSDLLTHRPTDF